MHKNNDFCNVCCIFFGISIPGRMTSMKLVSEKRIMYHVKIYLEKYIVLKKSLNKNEIGYQEKRYKFEKLMTGMG